MPDASFAGQHDMHLNINSNVKDISRHVVDCFSSLFTSRAISCRERNGLNHVEAGMAVVAQAMVHSVQSSGVLFTANPLTGRRNESALEAISGLEEALVSGLMKRMDVQQHKGKAKALMFKSKTNESGPS